MTVARVYSESLSEELRRELADRSLYMSVDFVNLWKPMGGRAVCWVAGEPCAPSAVLWGVEFGRGLLRRFQALPDGCYCEPWLSHERDRRDELRAVLLKGIGAAGYARVHVSDFHGQFRPDESFKLHACCTTLVDVSDPAWEPPDKGLQSEIRKAEREGVIPEPFDQTRHMAAFLRLMVHTEQRHGRKPKYSAEFFEGLAKLAERDSRILWWVVERDGRLAAAHIYLQSAEQLLNWQVYFDKEFSSLKPNQRMLFGAARTASARGCRYLNLGASPDTAASLAEYKRKWGGREHRYHCLTRQSWLGKLV